MKTIVIYIHGKGGSAEEAQHYRQLFPEYDVIGLDYQAQTPWDAKQEFSDYFKTIGQTYSTVILVANSIGAYFTMHANPLKQVKHAYFISPIVNMEKLIQDMLQWAGASESELQEKNILETAFGETLSWEYLSWVRAHPVVWQAPTSILYGSGDALQSRDAVQTFAQCIGADLTVMENGEHWFHTEEQMDFLDKWITRAVQSQLPKALP